MGISLPFFIRCTCMKLYDHRVKLPLSLLLFCWVQTLPPSADQLLRHMSIRSLNSNNELEACTGTQDSRFSALGGHGSVNLTYTRVTTKRPASTVQLVRYQKINSKPFHIEQQRGPETCLSWDRFLDLTKRQNQVSLHPCMLCLVVQNLLVYLLPLFLQLSNTWRRQFQLLEQQKLIIIITILQDCNMPKQSAGDIHFTSSALSSCSELPLRDMSNPNLPVQLLTSCYKAILELCWPLAQRLLMPVPLTLAVLTQVRTTLDTANTLTRSMMNNSNMLGLRTKAAESFTRLSCYSSTVLRQQLTTCKGSYVPSARF